MGSVPVRFGIDGHTANTELPAGPDDPDGDLSAVRDEDGSDQGRGLRFFEWMGAGKRTATGGTSEGWGDVVCWWGPILILRTPEHARGRIGSPAPGSALHP